MIKIIAVVLTVLMLNVPDLAVANNTEKPIDFTLQRLKGEELSLSEFRGKWLVP